MTNNLAPLVDAAFVLLATYVLHSTLWLLPAWLFADTCGRRSASLREQVWRFAAVAPFLTVAAQLIAQQYRTPWVWTIPDVSAVARAFDDGGHDPNLSLPSPRATAISSSARHEIGHSPENLPSADETPSRLLLAPLEPADAVLRPPQREADSAPTADSAAIAGSIGVRTAPAVHSRPAALASNDRVGDSPIVAATADVRELWPAWIVGIPAVWMVCGVLRVIWLGISCSIRVRRFPVLTDGVCLALVEELCHHKKVTRPVRVVKSDSFLEPAAFGLRRWTILVPVGLEDQIDRPQLRAVLAHELAHLVRGDVRWLWLGRVLRAAFGWQPLNSLAVRRWQEASEQLCDDWAVDGGIAPLTLAKSLTHLAELRLSDAAPAIGLPIIGRPSRLARRIQRLTEARWRDGWNTVGRRRLLTLTMITLALLFAWSGPQIVRAVPVPERPLVEASETASPIVESAAVAAPETAPAPEVPAIEIRPRIPSSDGSLSGDWNALRSDLEYAMKLLAESERDPEIADLANRIRKQLNELEVPSSESDR